MKHVQLNTVPNVMYGFGDSVRPSLKSAKMLTEMAELYIKSLVRRFSLSLLRRRKNTQPRADS